jgi:hypothetical protein
VSRLDGRIAVVTGSALIAFASLLATSARAQECPDPARCIDDYLALPSRLPKEELRDPPLTDAQVDALVAALDDTERSDEPISPQALAGRVERGLGLGFLRRAASRTPVAVDRGPRSSHSGYTQQALHLRDPYVGAIPAILLLPDGPGPFPAVLALHGHGDTAETYRDLHHGPDYPARGIALLVLTLRGMNIDAHEHRATQVLLAHGLELMGVRAYEALRALAYLRGLPEIDAQRIGLIGHSGGSSLGNLLVRLEPELAAYVSDHAVDYRSSGWREPYHCETVPALFPIHRQLDELSSAGPPVLRVRYGYGRRKLFGLDRRESRRILDFFAQHLQTAR